MAKKQEPKKTTLAVDINIGWPFVLGVLALAALIAWVF